MPIIPTSVAATLAEGAATGALAGASSGRRVGYAGTSNTTTTACRGTSYFPQGTDSQRFIKSTSALDTAEGTGARKVLIEYLKADGSGPFTEEVILNGTSEVATVATDIALIERMCVSECGSTGGNQGTIQLLTAAGGVVWASISVGDNQTYWAHHYVPLGKTCYITECRVGSKGVAGLLTINSLNPVNTAVPQRNLDQSVPYSNNDTQQQTFNPPIAVEGPAIIWLNVRADSNTATTHHASLGFFEQ